MRKTKHLTPVFQLICRAGFVSRGLVYLSLGSVALLAAADMAPRAKSTLASLQMWAQWPAGLALLWATGVGLYGFSLWRVLQAIFDADDLGRGRLALITRAGQLISGFLHAALAWAVFGLLDIGSDLIDPEEAPGAGLAVTQVLSWPGGELLMIVAGGFALVNAIGNVLKATGHPHRRLSCPTRVTPVAALLGRAGYAGRSIVFVALGILFIQAGLQARTESASGIGAALASLGRIGGGEQVLAIAAIGLLAFAAFAFLEARYRELGAGNLGDDVGASTEKDPTCPARPLGLE